MLHDELQDLSDSLEQQGKDIEKDTADMQGDMDTLCQQYDMDCDTNKDGIMDHRQPDSATLPSSDPCKHANDGECDVPQNCASGDYADCGSSSDPCDYANDGECDVPQNCASGDYADCGGSSSGGSNSGGASSGGNPAKNCPKCLGGCLAEGQCYTYDPKGVDGPSNAVVCKDKLQGIACPATEDPCQYAFDGTCDVPEHCSEGDFHDCGTSGESKQESATTATKATATKATATKDEQEPVKQEEGTSGGTSTAASDASSTVLFWGCQILVTTILSLHNVA